MEGGSITFEEIVMAMIRLYKIILKSTRALIGHKTILHESM